MKIITSILIAFLTFNLNAQECGTPTSTTNQVFNIPLENDSQFCVSIKFHIVRETNGTGGFDPSQIQNAINYINQFYNSHSINVSSVGFDYINNSNLNSFDDSKFSQLTSLNNVPNAINYYIVNTAPYYGRAGDIISNNLVIRTDRVLAPTSPHELGHCFNLLHTFQGTASGTSGCAESINGSNCSSCGDNVCDTPADANIEVTGGYNPDMTNIMSYYLTRNHFTAQQGARMRNAIGGSPILRATLSSQCSSITGLNNICATSNSQYTLNNPQNSTVVWTVSSNLQIVSSSNTSINISATNSTTNGQGIISVNINRMLITKNIWIGKPFFYIKSEKSGGPASNTLNLSIVSGNSVDINTQNITSSIWELVPSKTNYGAEIDGNEYIASLLYFRAGNYKIKITATNSCGTTTTIKQISTTTNTTTRLSNSNIYFIYPNPSKDIVNIDLRDQNNQQKKGTAVLGELFDLMGQSKSKIVVEDNKATFSVRDLNKGIYVLRILVNDQTETHQIVVE